MAARRRTLRHRTTPDQSASRVGSRVRRLRQEAGFTFDAFVEETGLGRGYVSELERGLVIPSLTALESMAAALGVTPADLVLGSTERERLFDRARRLAPAEVGRLLRLADRLHPPEGEAPAPPFRVVNEATARRHGSGLPLYSLKASAGEWSAPQAARVEAWVIVKLRVPSKRGLFVAQVTGRSMEPGIPDGAYCLFQRPWPSPRPREAGLFVKWEGGGDGEGEEAGRFTLKEYRPEARETELGDLVAGTLGARNPAHPGLAPSSLEDADERGFARLFRVLP